MNPHPRYSAKAQIEALTDASSEGGCYVEDRTGKVFDRLLRSLRKGDVVRVARPFLLAPIRGRPKTRRAKWLERNRAIRAKGARLMWIGNPNLNGEGLAMLASDEIAASGRGAAGRKKSGRPQFKEIRYTPEQWVIMEREWHSKKHATRDGALQVIRGYGIKVTKGYMYTHFPVKDDA